ncbi:biotin carboxylase N-terminal domain-containing protein [Amycolatopsis sp. QT-25]|uniref:acetyl-CoA carboxylase biotin carboxylase subunit n=1 Tax=Amycolatopsis sp. QT-25 TaxID=3034022 RepID=UPI0023ED3BE4|nr:biotin carboxylase N-terminal domain-containing protein [Amycolatopsis sp. QT-25]WET82466.1 biotin carboxylase N-terminal domain-containing protein [Amycolatopsis sp. QT-25]
MTRFETVFVPNRGEVALRIVRACRDLGLRSVVGHSAEDADSLPVRLADDSFCLGPAQATHSYLNIPAVLYGCAKTGADSVHPGYGFLSEDPLLARACADAGVVFVGPSAEHLALLGDKIATRQAFAGTGIPVLPGSTGPLCGIDDALDQAGRIGYPVVLKAAAGGGGTGVHPVPGPDELIAAFPRMTRNADRLFTDGRLFLERYVPSARHIEVQLLADQHGNIVHLGDRCCSVQRRYQKLLEEAPAPGLPSRLRRELHRAAVRGAEAIGLTSVATFEFLVTGPEEFFFIEANPRLQVEHPVTEAITGIDLVEWMLRVAAGERLAFDQDGVVSRGHAFEARINAEDPDKGWLPSTGRITDLVLPGGVGVRVDTHAHPGYRVPPFYDSLLAKVIVRGDDRPESLRRLGRALAEFDCAGVSTNTGVHQRVLAHPAFQAGDYGLDLVEAITAAVVR